jgi:hypothetical protein
VELILVERLYNNKFQLILKFVFRYYTHSGRANRTEDSSLSTVLSTWCDSNSICNYCPENAKAGSNSDGLTHA